MWRSNCLLLGHFLLWQSDIMIYCNQVCTARIVLELYCIFCTLLAVLLGQLGLSAIVQVRHRYGVQASLIYDWRERAGCIFCHLTI